MKLCIGIESEEKGIWRNIDEISFVQGDEFEEGLLNVPETEIEIEIGEKIIIYSIYVKETTGIFLLAKQGDTRIIELSLSCSDFIDLICTTENGCEVRFYTTA